MLALLAAVATLTAPQTFEGLNIDLPAAAKSLSSDAERKVWEAVEIQTYATGAKIENHRVTILITDFAALGVKGTADEMLAAHEENFRRRTGHTNVFAQRKKGKAGAVKGVMLYGYGRDAEGNSRTIASAAFAKGRKMHEVMWVTMSHRRQVPLASISKIMFDGVPVTGWSSAIDGEFSMKGFPFVVSGKDFIGAEVWKADTGYVGGYFASSISDVVDTRFIAVQLKPDDKRTDTEIFKDLLRRGMSTYDDAKVPDLSKGSADATMEVDFLGVLYLARAAYMRKGEWVGLLTVQGKKSPTMSAEIKKPSFNYVVPGK